jgi:hypothetical protein
MARRIERVFRNRKLTAEEAARDSEIRHKVKAEFPPLRVAGSAAADSLSETLRQAIRESGKSMYEIAKESGVSQTVLSRFVFRERDIRMATADKLAEVIALKLTCGS